MSDGSGKRRRGGVDVRHSGERSLRRSVGLSAVLLLAAAVVAATVGAGEVKAPAGVPPTEAQATGAVPDEQQDGPSAAPAEADATLQGPAATAPREILAMLDQRKRALDKKEETLRVSEARLATLKSEIEAILARHEESVKLQERKRQDQNDTKSAEGQRRVKAEAEAKKVAQAQLAKIYETMPAEEAAVRIEKMPEKTALDLLRLLKGKTAGAILAQMHAAKAAKLTEQLIPQ